MQLTRFGKEWAEVAAARSIVWYVCSGSQHRGLHRTPMDAWEAITGLDFNWEGAQYTVAADLRKKILVWAFAAAPAATIHQLHPHSCWTWLEFFSPKQQQRIVEILYERYPS